LKIVISRYIWAICHYSKKLITSKEVQSDFYEEIKDGVPHFELNLKDDQCTHRDGELVDHGWIL
jgi:hypothetical protein